MESRDLIDKFRAELDIVEEQGTGAVPVAALRHYLSDLEKVAGDSLEIKKQQHEGALAHYAAQNEANLEMMRSVLEAGKSAIHALLIINGGAVVALLGVLSNLAQKTNGAVMANYLALPLLQFGIGVLTAAMTFGFRYFSQACYAESCGQPGTYLDWGKRLTYAAIALGVAGYVLFGFGIFNAYHAVVWSFAP